MLEETIRTRSNVNCPTVLCRTTSQHLTSMIEWQPEFVQQLSAC